MGSGSLDALHEAPFEGHSFGGTGIPEFCHRIAVQLGEHGWFDLVDGCKKTGTGVVLAPAQYLDWDSKRFSLGIPTNRFDQKHFVHRRLFEFAAP